MVAKIEYDNFGNVDVRTEGLVRVYYGSRDSYSYIEYNQDSRATQYEYDELNRQTKTLDPGYFDSVLGRVFNTDGPGRTKRSTEVVYDGVGNAVASHTTLNYGNHTSRYKTYDAFGSVIHEVDEDNYLTKYSYNALKENVGISRYSEDITISAVSENLEFVTRQDMETEITSIETNAENRNKTREIEMIYDLLGRKSSVVQSAISYYSNIDGTTSKPQSISAIPDHNSSPTTNYRYNAFGELIFQEVHIDQGNSNKSYNYYDAHGRKTHTIDGLNFVTETQYDQFGNVEKTIEYSRRQTESFVDPTARPEDWSLLESSQDRILGFQYNELNQQKSVSRHNYKHSTWNTTSNDFISSEFSRYGAGNILTSNEYDAVGNLIESTDGIGNVTSYEYNDLGHLEKLTQPSRTAVASTVNDSSNLFYGSSATVRPEIHYSVDAFGQIVEEVHDPKTLLGGIKTINHFYDIAGNEYRTENAQGNDLLRKFDVNGRVIEETQYADAGIPRTQRVSTTGNAFLSDTYTGGLTATREMGPSKFIYYYDATGIVPGTMALDFNYGGNTLMLSKRDFKSHISVSYVLSEDGAQYDHDVTRQFKYDDRGNQIAAYDVFENQTPDNFFTLGESIRAGQVVEINAFGEMQTKYYEAGREDYSNIRRDIIESAVYDKVGNLIEKTDANGVTAYHYDLLGNTTLEIRRDFTDGRNRITEWVRDEGGNLIEERKQRFSGIDTSGFERGTVQLQDSNAYYGSSTLNPNTSREYDRWGNVTKFTDETGHTSSYEYNHENNLMRETAYVYVADFDRSDSEQLRGITATRHRLNYFDEAGRNIGNRVQINYGAASNGYNQETLRNYNNLGQLVSERDATGILKDYRYDGHGNKVAEVTGGWSQGTNYFYDYDIAGNLTDKSIFIVSDTDSRIGEKIHLNEYHYDQLGRRFAETAFATEQDVIGGVMRYTYDERSNLVRSENEEGITTNYTFDTFNRKHSEANGVGFSKVWEYESDYAYTRVASLEAGIYGSQTLLSEYTYNDFGQVLTESKSYTDEVPSNNEVPDRTYHYYSNGLLATVSENYFAVNKAGRTAEGITGLFPTDIMSTTDTVKQQNYKYDIRGLRVIESTTEDSTVTDYGEIEAEGHASNTTIVWREYSLANRTTSETEESYHTFSAYDAEGQLIRVESPRSSNSDADLKYLRYGYDGLGNRIYIGAEFIRPVFGSAEVESMGHWYAYDKAGRVTIDRGEFNENENLVEGGPGTEGSTVYVYDFAGRIDTATEYSISRTTKMFTASDLYSGAYAGSDPSKWMLIPGGVDYGPNSSANKYNPDHPSINGILISQVSTTGQTPIPNTVRFALNEFVTEVNKYRYDKLGRQDQLTTNTVEKWNADYNLRGFQTRYKEMETSSKGTETISTYRKDGQALVQHSFEIDGNSRLSLSRSVYSSSNSYDSAGNLVNYSVTRYGDTVYTSDYYSTYDHVAGQYLVTNKRVSPGANAPSYLDDGSTSYSYDRWGNNTVIRTEGESSRTYNYNFDGQIIKRRDPNQDDRRVNYYYQAGNLLGSIGLEEVSLAPALLHETRAGSNVHVIKAGDTLSSIAKLFYGDASLWYLIAEENASVKGPSDQFTTSEAGTSLRMPSLDTTLRNTAQTFQPYNPGEIIGDTTPTLQVVPPPQKSCNPIAMIIMVVVAVVVTIYTAGAAASLMGASLASGATGTAALGGAALAGGGGLALTGTAAALGSVGTAMAASFVGGFVGSVASQVVGKGLGVVEHFSLRQAVAGGLTSAFSAGAAGYLSGTSAFGANQLDKAKNIVKVGEGFSNAGKAARTLSTAGKFVQGAASAASGIAAGKLAGLENTSFRWESIAASAIGSYAGGEIGTTLRVDQIASPLLQGTLQGTINGAAVAHLNKQWNRGGKVDFAQIAVDAFGNALADSVVSVISDASQSKGAKQLSAFEKQYKDTERKTKEKTAEMIGAAAVEADNVLAEATSARGERGVEEVIVTAKRRRSVDQQKLLVSAMISGQALDGVISKINENEEHWQQTVEDIKEDRRRFNRGVNAIAERSGRQMESTRAELGLQTNAERAEQQQQLQFALEVNERQLEIANTNKENFISFGKEVGRQVVQPLAQVADLSLAARGLIQNAVVDATGWGSHFDAQSYYVSEVGDIARNGGGYSDTLPAGLKSSTIGSTLYNSFKATTAIQEGNYEAALGNIAAVGLNFIGAKGVRTAADAMPVITKTVNNTIAKTATTLANGGAAVVNKVVSGVKSGVTGLKNFSNDYEIVWQPKAGSTAYSNPFDPDLFPKIQKKVGANRLSFGKGLNSKVELEAKALIAEGKTSGVALSRSGIPELDITSKSFQNIPFSLKKGRTFPGTERFGDTGELIRIKNSNAYVDEIASLYAKAGNDLNPAMRARIKAHAFEGAEFGLKDAKGLKGLPGLHAEVQSANYVLNRAPVGYDVGKIQVSTYKLQNSPGQGAAFTACNHCTGILDGFDILTGY